MHLVEPVKRGAVLLKIEIQRLEQPDESYAAFVFDRIAHSGLKYGQRYGFFMGSVKGGAVFFTAMVLHGFCSVQFGCSAVSGRV